MAAGTMSSRVLGVLRASLLAGVIGTNGLTADAFQTANTLPNQFYLLLAGGILNAVMVPQLVRAMQREDGGVDFVNRLMTAALVLIAGATIVTTALAPVLVRVYLDVDDPQAIALATTFAFICLPQILFYGLYTLFGQILNANSRFAAYMWVPAIANIIAIAGLLWFRAEAASLPVPVDAWSPRLIWILAGTATLSIAVQALALIVPLRRIGFRYRPRWGFRGFGLGSASQVATWTLAAVVVSQLGFVLTSRVTSSAAGAVAAGDPTAPSRATFDNAFLIFMLPHSLITVSLVTALFTRMAKAAHAGDMAELVADVRRGVRMPALLLVPIVAIAYAFAPTITRTLYFTNSLADTEALASMVRPLLLGVIPFGWFYLSERFFYAHEDARTPFAAQLTVTSIASVVTLFAATLDPSRTSIVVAFGQSTAYLGGATLGFALIRRRVGLLGLRSVAATVVKLVVPGALIATTLWALAGALLPSPAPSRLVGLGVLAVVGIVELVGTLLAAHLLGVTEVGELLAPVRRRLRRS
jgi:putative peptidoglycan lipid II flippase